MCLEDVSREGLLIDFHLMNFIDSFEVVAVVVGMQVLPDDIGTIDSSCRVEDHEIFHREVPIMILIVSVIRLLDPWIFRWTTFPSAFQYECDTLLLRHQPISRELSVP